MTPPPCECPLAGYCERHKKTKGPSMHRLCQTRDDYRAKWDRDVAKPEPKARRVVTATPPAPRRQYLDCSYRGEQVGTVEACGCANGDVPIHLCSHPEINGQVLLRGCGKRPHTLPFQGLPVCQKCNLYATQNPRELPPASPSDTAPSGEPLPPPAIEELATPAAPPAGP